MSKYDYKCLSSVDFEELSRDLLQKEWGVYIESFKEGKDQGIDLRCYTIDKGNTIIQCKNYASSGFSNLFRDLKKKELSKVNVLSPKRYVLVTSVPLSPSNKSKIQQLFIPYIESTADIIGCNDLDNLISKNTDVENRHFKLWLTSTSVLARVLKNASIVQSNLEIEKIRRKLPLYVQTSSLPTALDILDKNHFLIISGIPGIGKTTLAEILLYIHLDKGYDLIKITENIKEAYDLYYTDRKQIFYYDDFLGQTILNDRLRKNEDSAIANFIDLVSRNRNTRFIMTTREYILQNAKIKYEKLFKPNIESAKYILELSDYSKNDKARILYNHLYFSELPEAYINELLKNSYYLNIIDHKNFSPRIIEWMSGSRHVQAFPVSQYRSIFKKTLDHPDKLWDHAFNNHIEQASQILLLALYSLGTLYSSGRKANIEVLRGAFGALQEKFIKKYKVRASPQDFLFALKELEGTFTLTTQDSIGFHNPSVKDFLELKLSQEASYAELLLSSAIYFGQVDTLWRQNVEGHDQSQKINCSKQQLIETLRRTLDNDVICIETSGGISSYVVVDTSLLDRALIICEMFNVYKDLEFLELLNQAIDNIIKSLDNDNENDMFSNDDDYIILNKLMLSITNMKDIDETFRGGILKKMQYIIVYSCEFAYYLRNISNLYGTYDRCMSYVDQEIYFSIRNAFENYLDIHFNDDISENSYSNDLFEMSNELEYLGQKFNIDVNAKYSELINKAEESAEEESSYEDMQYEEWREAHFIAEEEEANITDMFDSLKK